MTEQELVRSCLEGKREAQQALFRQYSGVMMTVCLRYTSSRDEAADVLQEGFIKVFQKLDQWQNRGPLGGWIRMIMVNTALTDYRKRTKWGPMEDVEGAHEVRDIDASAVSRMSADELMAMIHALPQGYKMVFNLFAVEGYSHKEIADMLGISENTSKTQFLKARTRLQKEIEKKNAIARPDTRSVQQ